MDEARSALDEEETARLPAQAASAASALRSRDDAAPAGTGWVNVPLGETVVE